MVTLMAILDLNLLYEHHSVTKPSPGLCKVGAIKLEILPSKPKKPQETLLKLRGHHYDFEEDGEYDIDSSDELTRPEHEKKTLEERDESIPELSIGKRVYKMLKPSSKSKTSKMRMIPTLSTYHKLSLDKDHHLEALQVIASYPLVVRQ